MNKSPVFESLAVVGPGLIGSSLLRRSKENGDIARYLIAIDHDPSVVKRAKELELADFYTTDLAAGVKNADAVILCTPTGSIETLASDALKHMQPGSILSDVASVRGKLGPKISSLLPKNIHYIPAHPMAGTEFSGPDAGFSTLFENRWCLVVPPENSSESAISKIELLWQKCGARTRRITDEYHDHVCAMVSHLPHLLAFTICDTADRLSSDLRADVLEYAASGFRDFTRIAASDPIMWRDIFLANRDVILEILERFQKETEKMAQAIRDEKSEDITDRIKRGRRIRQTLIANHQA
ncbi:prephenate dehydrogenase/arogenate dehydrogenase family protein [Aristophania vespae]|uniref:Prephenate dehydrogenase/arogenate dehydrogenase family protein n=1 Tax=Aristophania vespae TaxID=2697033 RepID=A0A6P1NID8_9PROT|nr:prephenate dehydrogenase/arogenate dehydrogenase family protein [Aristophania vespae]QHI95422.1 prephenate dehydrogenase/arogenate dehydrogenase family protein [Aristophania vespae]UMM64716.1 Cyclohexadienyl dehydrogenase [Aristophania vespae]